MELNRILFGVFSVLVGYFIAFIGVNYTVLKLYEDKGIEIELIKVIGGQYGFGLIPYQFLLTVILAIAIYYILAKFNKSISKKSHFNKKG